jgi:hypothetical protein
MPFRWTVSAVTGEPSRLLDAFLPDVAKRPAVARRRHATAGRDVDGAGGQRRESPEPCLQAVAHLPRAGEDRDRCRDSQQVPGGGRRAALLEPEPRDEDGGQVIRDRLDECRGRERHAERRGRAPGGVAEVHRQDQHREADRRRQQRIGQHQCATQQRQRLARGQPTAG